MRTIIIGDIHGMLPELRALLQDTGFSKEDRLVLVGDLVDKGPDSAGVVRFLRTLRDNEFDVVLVLGNHEEKHARFRLARARTPAGVEIKMKGVEELTEITDRLLPQDVAFLDTAVLFYRIPDLDALVVHGGILPVTANLDDPTDKALRAKVVRVRHVTRDIQTRLTVELVLPYELSTHLETHLDEIPEWSQATIMKKVVRAAGEFITLGDEKPEDPFWADVYDGRFGHVYFGHSPFVIASEPVQFPHATGLDLGAVHGNRLAAAVVEPGCLPKFVTVQASGKFAASLWEE